MGERDRADQSSGEEGGVGVGESGGGDEVDVGGSEVGVWGGWFDGLVEVTRVDRGGCGGREGGHGEGEGEAARGGAAEGLTLRERGGGGGYKRWRRDCGWQWS